MSRPWLQPRARGVNRRAAGSTIYASAMSMTKALTTLSTTVSSRLRRLRPRTALMICILFASLLLIVISFLTTHLLLLPLARLSFHISGRVASPLPRTQTDAPSGAAAYALGIASQAVDLDWTLLPMRRPEAALLLSYIRPGDRVLCIGPREIAVALAAGGAAVTAVQPPSFGHRHCRGGGAFRAVCLPASVACARIDNLNMTRLDRVVLDGGARVACARAVLPLLTDDGLVFVHDFFRRPARYAAVLGEYEEVARVVAFAGNDGPGGLLVLRKRKAAQMMPAVRDEGGDEFDDDGEGLDVAVRVGLLSTENGGFDYYGMAREISRQSAHARLALDLAGLPVVLMLVWALRSAVKVFVDSVYRRRENLTARKSDDVTSVILGDDTMTADGGEDSGKAK